MSLSGRFQERTIAFWHETFRMIAAFGAGPGAIAALAIASVPSPPWWLTPIEGAMFLLASLGMLSLLLCPFLDWIEPRPGTEMSLTEPMPRFSRLLGRIFFGRRTLGSMQALRRRLRIVGALMCPITLLGFLAPPDVSLSVACVMVMPLLAGMTLLALGELASYIMPDLEMDASCDVEQILSGR